MRNAAVAALIYEFLFGVYRKIEHDRKFGFIEWLPDESGVLREAFNHDFIGGWEWGSDMLERVGVLKTLKREPRAIAKYQTINPHIRSPYSYPLMSLDECRIADFSSFETFDNYCYAMWTFEYVEKAPGYNEPTWSPYFSKEVASNDDIFHVDGERIVFDKQRYEEKILTRWSEMEVRTVRPKGDA
jgi:hypothetical protein